MENKPLVSICIPTYNGERYLQECLDSAINQTYKNIEIVVSDDNSKDKTLEIVKEYKNKIEIPFFIYHHEPNGIGANWNNCIRKANGEYIKFLFQDDTIVPECVEKMVNLAIKDNKIGLIFSKRNFLLEEKTPYFDAWISNFSNLHSSWHDLKSINNGQTLLKNCSELLSTPGNKVGEPTVVLLKKEVFKTVGFFNETLVQILDYEFWYRVFHKYKIGFIDEELASFRLHDQQATQKNIGIYSDSEIYIKLLYKNIYGSLHPDVKKNVLEQNDNLYRFYKKIKNKLTIILKKINHVY